MTVLNAEIAAAFEEMADLLELQQENPFRVRAYRTAARTIDSWPEQMADLIAQGQDLDELPGIGKDLASKIREIIEHGSCPPLDRLRASFPAGITDLLQVPGLGPKRVHALYHELGVRSPSDLLAAAREGRVRELHGFGATSEKRIAETISGLLERTRRWPITRVVADVDALIAHLRGAPDVSEAVAAGSFRRRRDTVGDLDILVTAPSGHALAERLQTFAQVKQVLAHGPTRAAVVLRSGLQVDLRVVPPASFGATLVYFTGSKPHNIALRRLAMARQLKINEYGVYRDGERIAGDTEASVYAGVGLPCIPPELREDRGEIEAAREHALPRLVERAELRGDLHVQTEASGGGENLEQLATAAHAAGLRYMAIADRLRNARMTQGLDAAGLRKQSDAIDRLNARLHGIVLLKGVEVEILEDGSLDLHDAELTGLDVVIGAVHGAFDLPRAQQTERVMRAMDHPDFGILAHPNGRLFGTRGPCDLDMDRLIRHARQRGCFLELNAHPDRLDLFDLQCRQAKDAGVPVVISSGASRGADFGWLQFGIDQARRGWLGANDVLNTLSLHELRQRLAAIRHRSSPRFDRRATKAPSATELPSAPR